jgi:hypothetical protein
MADMLLENKIVDIVTKEYRNIPKTLLTNNYIIHAVIYCNIFVKVNAKIINI